MSECIKRSTLFDPVRIVRESDQTCDLYAAWRNETQKRNTSHNNAFFLTVNLRPIRHYHLRHWPVACISLIYWPVAVEREHDGDQTIPAERRQRQYRYGKRECLQELADLNKSSICWFIYWIVDVPLNVKQYRYELVYRDTGLMLCVWFVCHSKVSINEIINLRELSMIFK